MNKIIFLIVSLLCMVSPSKASDSDVNQWLTKLDKSLEKSSVYMKKYTKFIKNIRLWGTCGNVCCITGYSGMNPEVNIAGWDQGTEKFWDGYYPMARTWTFGMQFNF